MLSLDVHDGIAGVKIVIGKQQCLIHIAAGVVADVKDEVLHPLIHQVLCCLLALQIGRFGEFVQAQISHGPVHHERSVHAVHGNLAARNLERNDIGPTLHGDGNLAAGRAFDVTHHAVLGKLDARNHQIIHLQEPVPHPEAHLLGRPAGNHFQHDGGIVGHVELDADAFEVPGQFLFRGAQLHGRQVHGMRIQAGQGRLNGALLHLGMVHIVHIVLVQQVQHHIQFGPGTIADPHQVAALAVLHHR